LHRPHRAPRKATRCQITNHKGFPPFKSRARLTDSGDPQSPRTDT
jgi:hypothetical protein